MKQLLSMTVLGLALSVSAAHAQEPAKHPQQNKMAVCNKNAEGKKGDERKAFMKECLSAKAAEPDTSKNTPQQNKMKTCNAEAKGLKGDERKQKMSECLKG